MKLRALVLATLLVVAALSVGSAVAPVAAQAGNVTGTYDQTTPVQVDSCTTIDQQGTYTLTAAIANDTTGACIEINASDVILDGQGHTVDGVNDGGTGVAIADASVSNVTVRNLTVRNFDDGVSVKNANAVTLRNVTATDSGTEGVTIDGASDVTVEGGELQDNSRQGLYATDVSASLAVRNATIASNGAGGGFAGLYVEASAQVTVANSTVDDNPGEGIGVFETTGVEIRNNTVTSNGGPGVEVGYDSDDTTVADNTVSSNQRGIVVRGSQPGNSADGVTVSGNDVSDSVEEGIRVLNSDSVTIADTSTRNSGASGLNATNAGGLLVENLTATGNGNDGVHLDDVDGATVAGGEMNDNGERGIYATHASTSLVVRNTTISSNDEDGVRALGLVVSSSSAQVTIENNTLDSNPSGGGGIGVTETTGAEIRNNTASNSGGPGVWLESGSADGVVADNILTSNWKGIQVGRSVTSGYNGADGVTVSGNEVTDSTAEGIHVLGSANVVVSGNDVTSNGGQNAIFGINATASPGSTVANNTVSNNIGGVYLLDSDDASARDNVVTGNDYGLIVEDATGATVAANDVTANAYDGINVFHGSDTVVRNNTATGNEWGLFLVQTENVTATANDVSDNVNGTALEGTTNVTLTDTNATNSGEWALTAFDGSTIANARNYTLADGTSVNFSARDARIAAPASVAALPGEMARLGPAVDATGANADAWLHLSVGYDGSAVLAGEKEPTALLHRYDGSWSDAVGGTNGVDAANDTVTANVTDFGSGAPASTFAALAETEAIPATNVSRIDYGEVNLGNAPTSSTVNVTNEGQGTMNVTGLDVTGANASDFDVQLIDNVTIAPGASATFDVAFDPSALGDRTATLAIAHDAPDSPETIALNGTGVVPDANVTTDAPVAFGDVDVGEVGQTRTVTIENNGTAPLTLQDAEIEGANASAFDFDPEGGDATPYFALDPGDSVRFYLEFQPLSVGDATASLNVTTNSTVRPHVGVALTGTGVDATPPTITGATAVNAADGLSAVDDDGAVAVSATVTDNVAVDVVTANASALGADTVELTDGDGNDVYDETVTVDAANATEGTYELPVTATDAEGNENDTVTSAITVDMTDPTLTITQPAEGEVLNDSDPHMEGDVTDALSGAGTVEFVYPSYTSGWEEAYLNHSSGHWEAQPMVGGLPDGEYTLPARATDNAGNVGSNVTVNVTVDTTPPSIQDATLSTNAGGAFVTDGDEVTVSADVTDATTNVTAVTANASAFGAGTVTLTESAVADHYNATFTVDADAAEGGSQSLDVNAADEADNEGTAATGSLTLDVNAPAVTAPTLTDATDSNGAVNGSDEVTVSATVTDAESGVENVTANASAFGVETVTLTDGNGDDTYNATVGVNESAAAADGNYSVTVTAVDNVSHSNSTPTNALALDTTVPNVTIDDPAEDAVLDEDQPILAGEYDQQDRSGVTTVEYDSGSGWTDSQPLSGGTWSSFPAQPALDDGEHTFAARAIDDAGNVGPNATVNVTVDTTDPVIENATVTNDAGGAFVTDGDEVTVSADVTDATTNVTAVTANASAFGAGTVTLTESAVADHYNATFTVDADAAEGGSQSLDVNAADEADNDGTAATGNLPLDVNAPAVTAPTLTDATDGDGAVNGSDEVTVEATVTDAESGVENVTANASAFGVETVTLTDGNGDDVYDATFSVDGSAAAADGDHAVTVTAVDNASLSNETATGALTLDTTDPTLTITQPAEGEVLNDSDPRMEGNVTDALSGAVTVEVHYGSAWDREAIINHSTGHWETPPMVGGLDDGEYTLTARPIDDAGNVGPAEAVNVTIDTTAPSIEDATLSTDAGGAYVIDDDQMTVSANVSDATTNVSSVRANASAFGAGTVTLSDGNGDDNYTATFTVDAAAAESGPHALDVNATDEANNDGTAATGSLTLDVDAPAVVNATASDATDGNGVVADGDSIELGAEVTDATSGVETVSVNASAFDVGTVNLTDGNGDDHYTANITVDGSNASADGDHSLGLDAIDAAGNANQTAAGSLAVDTTPPTVAVSAPANGSHVNATPPTITGTVNDSVAGVASVEFYNGTNWTAASPDRTNGTWSATPSGLDDGNHTFRVRATDDAGNDASPLNWTITVDTVAPTAAIAGGNRSVDEDTAVSFDATNASDDRGVAAYEWDFGDGATATGATPTHAFADPGTSTVALTVADAAGNENATNVTVTVRNVDEGDGGGGGGGGISRPPSDTAPPTADAGEDRTVAAGSEVALNGSGSSDDHGITLHQWDVDGDGANELSGAEPTHRFEEPGTYDVELTVYDGNGNEDADVVTITVTGDGEGPATPGIEIDGVDAPDRVAPGEEIEVTADVTNAGDRTRTANVSVALDGQQRGTEEVTLDPDATTTVSLATTAPETAGNYSWTASTDGGAVDASGVVAVRATDGSDDTGTDDGSPGFGVLAAGLGLLGALAIGRRRGWWPGAGGDSG